MANERHQEHGGQETLQGPDEEVHGKKEMAGNAGVALDSDVAPHVCFIGAILNPKIFASVSEIVWDQD